MALGCALALMASGARAADGDGAARRQNRQKARQEARERVGEAQENREQKREGLQERAGQRVDQRQDNQARRIQHGIDKGYLTDAEVEKLEAQQKGIADLESSYKLDGRLTRDEFKDLRQELNEASGCIWAEKHDTEGNQMPAYRWGKNVFARSELTDRIESGDYTREEARQLMKDLHRTLALKRALAGGNLSAEARATMQGEFDELLNKYFEQR
jgi:hypothetical protein